MNPLLDQLRFDQRGLVPVVVQDADRGDVLMLAYADREALTRTLAEGRAWFFSRSRQRLWRKGETSGNELRVREVRVDCDGDAVLYRVEPAGPACHTGERSCFYRTVGGQAGTPDGRPAPQAGVAGAQPEGLGELSRLEAVVRRRQQERPAGSYTTRLFEAGLPRILQKVGEEAVETVVAAGHQEQQRVVEEAADLLYHLTVLLVARDVSWQDVAGELRRRAGGD
ncbi:phosphoribosyl-ATP diphosphatase [Thermaerobacter marianensis DSM 12885]|uniref:Histidine biosynthesis bifunctional protein HisIE n=1 Tax=Thermaerobacter marianensis (strain ATCC 700841 / DSM 12885 / JCM 10246 / 7p75a) TaxID=644966 RepID=E6SHE7_THEM7|nr:bifunctional phosphoribosyl-AMP cyclohydrolase/phosphoribosyl-ATP diphosphatase HisIE [Thermaerobacter marianensis]ADU50711.1 phosphoribosyl-ATP diphosphatase [Thermaerobacter marianensis DSM 12885]